MADIAGRIDRFQRRFRPVSIPLSVIYKFFDDQGNYLAAVVTYYSFITIFPALLLASSVLGFVLQGNPHLQEQILTSALGQFPIIGDQLQAQSLTGSTSAIVAGLLTALYGALGLGMALQNVANTAWSVPRNSRPNPLLLRLKSLMLLLTAGVAVLAVIIVSTVGGNVQQLFGARVDSTLKLLIAVVTVLVVGMVLTLLFRVSAARDHRLTRSAPGGFAVAVMWMGLQYVGAAYVTHVLAKASSANKTFGLVLGLLAFIYIAAVMAVIGIEINVVLARRLFPRALLTPFTDAVELTEADRRAYTSYARMQRHKGFETVEVSFDKRGADRAGGPDGPAGPVELHAVPDPPVDPDHAAETETDDADQDRVARTEGPAVS